MKDDRAVDFGAMLDMANVAEGYVKKTIDLASLLAKVADGTKNPTRGETKALALSIMEAASKARDALRNAAEDKLSDGEEHILNATPEQLEAAQARLLKLEVWAKDAILYLLTDAEPNPTALIEPFKDALDDIGAAKKLLAGVINDAHLDEETDEGEDK